MITHCGPDCQIGPAGHSGSKAVAASLQWLMLAGMAAAWTSKSLLHARLLKHPVHTPWTQPPPPPPPLDHAWLLQWLAMFALLVGETCLPGTPGRLALRSQGHAEVLSGVSI